MAKVQLNKSTHIQTDKETDMRDAAIAILVSTQAGRQRYRQIDKVVNRGEGRLTERPTNQTTNKRSTLVKTYIHIVRQTYRQKDNQAGRQTDCYSILLRLKSISSL